MRTAGVPAFWSKLRVTVRLTGPLDNRLAGPLLGKQDIRRLTSPLFGGGKEQPEMAFTVQLERAGASYAVYVMMRCAYVCICRQIRSEQCLENALHSCSSMRIDQFWCSQHTACSLWPSSVSFLFIYMTSWFLERCQHLALPASCAHLCLAPPFHRIRIPAADSVCTQGK